MFCAISGSVPESAAVSKSSGHIFERKLVEKYIQETGKHPITGEVVTKDDLLFVVANKTVKPRPSNASSIPGLLGIFHDEWDALMLETHTLRQSLHTNRQELSHALYQHDAACRVIARLIKERDEARHMVEALREQVKAEVERAAAAGKRPPEEAEAMEEDGAPVKKAKKAEMTAEVVEELTQVSAELSKARKKRVISDTLAKPEELEAEELLGSHPLHSTTTPGITCVDLHPEKENTLLTGGADGTLIVFDSASARVLATLEGHSKKVTGGHFVTANVVVSSSADKTARLWTSEGEGQPFTCTSVMRDHTAEVVGVTVHPSRNYFVTASADRTWAFWDVETTTCLKQVNEEAVQAGYTCVQFHPDGLILGTGTTEKLVRMWEVKSQKNVAQFEGHNSPVRALSFSENGYFLATAGDDGVKLWDLRKLKNFKSLEPYDDSPCHDVAFDHSGLYLAVAGADARVYGVKQDWAAIKTFPGAPKRGVLSLRWGVDARSLYAGGADHILRLYGQPA